MSASTRDALSAVDALSPVDGRYRAATEPLRGLLSEAGLIRERIRIEAQWLVQLSAAGATEEVLELVHFGCTSEDINNLSYARILHAARSKLLETFEARVKELGALAHRYADTA